LPRPEQLRTPLGCLWCAHRSGRTGGSDSTAAQRRKWQGRRKVSARVRLRPAALLSHVAPGRPNAAAARPASQAAQAGERASTLSWTMLVTKRLDRTLPSGFSALIRGAQAIRFRPRAGSGIVIRSAARRGSGYEMSHSWRLELPAPHGGEAAERQRDALLRSGPDRSIPHQDLSSTPASSAIARSEATHSRVAASPLPSRS
jgi:hypothetical protein